MKKKTIRLLVLALILLAVCLYFVSGTYARYTSQTSGNAEVDVAKWVVALKDGDAELKDDFTVTATVEANADVVSDKIAPGCTATAEISVDLTGTEVSVDILADVDADAIAEKLGLTKDQISVTAEVSGATEDGYVALVNDTAFTASNGVKTVTITVTWDNIDTDPANEEDTALGKVGGTIQIPVELTVQQHIGA